MSRMKTSSSLILTLFSPICLYSRDFPPLSDLAVNDMIIAAVDNKLN